MPTEPTPAELAAEMRRLSEAATAAPWQVLTLEQWTAIEGIPIFSGAQDAYMLPIDTDPEDVELINFLRNHAAAIAECLERLAELERERTVSGE